jgi:hypothetical protein
VTTNGMPMPPSDDIEHLANLLARHKLVPFIGAGCSLGQVPYDWDGIADAMATSLGVQGEGLGHTVVADLYERTHGRPVMDRFLAERLTVDTFDDAKGGSYLALFRAMFDIAIIPKDAEGMVARLYCELARRVSTAEEARNLYYAQVNLHLPFEHTMEVQAAVIACANALFTDGDMIMFMPTNTNLRLPDNPDTFLMAATLAKALLREWGRPISAVFRRYVANHARRADISAVPAQLQPTVRDAFNRIYGAAPNKNQLSRPGARPALSTPTAHTILASTLDSYPHAYKAPTEE